MEYATQQINKMARMKIRALAQVPRSPYLHRTYSKSSVAIYFLFALWPSVAPAMPKNQNGVLFKINEISNGIIFGLMTPTAMHFAFAVIFT